MKPVVCFGEIMARFSPAGRLRLRQVLPGSLEVTFAGSEVNVGVAIAHLGGRAEFVTALPHNSLSEACLAAVRATGVGVSRVVLRDLGRLGLYFVEAGANQRGGQVIYDREGSTFALSGTAAYDWSRIMANAGWFHVSGVAAGVSAPAAAATLAGIQAARAGGLTVSCDLNFRRKLWGWEPGTSAGDLARRVHGELLPGVDVLIGNPFDLSDLLGESMPDNVLNDDVMEPALFAELACRVGARWPQLRWIAMTLRRNLSANHNSWGAPLYRPADGLAEFAPMVGDRYRPHEIRAMVDRVGTGDSFAGALIFALQTPALAEPSRALRFAVAASCLSHSIQGDFLFCSRAEVEALMNGNDSGHLSR